MEQPGPVILFDGVCNLCNRFVQLVIRHDRRRQFRFASLQSPYAQTLLQGKILPDSVVLYEGGKFYSESTAALRVLRRLDGLWPLCYSLLIVPRFLRDIIYRRIARNRYRWWGKSDTCMVPSPELADLFLS